MYDNLENGMVSGSAHYGAPFDEPLSPSELAYIYGDRDTEKTAPVQTERPAGKTYTNSIPENQPFKITIKPVDDQAKELLPTTRTHTVKGFVLMLASGKVREDRGVRHQPVRRCHGRRDGRICP